MIKDRTNSEHYFWGNGCQGWRLNDGEELSVIEETMSPGTAEKRHYHQVAFQFFYILKGTAVFEVENKEFTVNALQGFSIAPGTIHLIKNMTGDELHFLVISQPTTKNDRLTIDI